MKEIYEAYNNAWESGKIEKPVSVLIGGHIGTGKSSFTKLLEHYISPIYQIPTGIIRAIEQANTTSVDQPILFAHSYDLHNVIYRPDLTIEDRAIIAFQEQAKHIEKAVVNILRFSETEGQQFIIEGNHILPAFTAQQINKKNVISLFFKTTDLEQYTKMISGPTHKRNFTSEQLYLIRHIHDFIVNEAGRLNQTMFEFNQTDNALAHIAKKLEELLP